MMRRHQQLLISLLLSSFLLSLAACSSKAPHALYALPQIQYSSDELQNKGRSIASEESKEHTKKELKSYLSYDLPFAAFEKIRRSVEGKLNSTLKNRGEAHITVVSPPEYEKMEKKISMKEINTLADEMNLSQSPYKLLCVGKGSIKDHDKEKSTYYVVVESDRLFQIRKAVQMLYIKKGGNAGDFNPDLYYPHVTLGFTDRDLHYEDGVIKDATSCLYSLTANNELIKK